MNSAQRLALLGILTWALALRLWDLWQPFIGDYAWNEVYYASIARGFFSGSLLVQHDLQTNAAVYSCPLVPWLVYGSMRLFGPVEWAARLPILVFGLSSLMLLFLLARLLWGNAVALAAALLAASAPGIVFFSRNVQLDGVMTALGLGATLAMLLYRRGRGRWWLGAALALFTGAVLVKLTAVLFWPALAWVWCDLGTSARSWRRWPGLLLFSIAAVAPAVVWIVLVPHLQPAADGNVARNAYFLRSHEWKLQNFLAAALSLWPFLSRQLGAVVWYPAIITAVLATAAGWWRAALRRYSLAVMLMVPWFAQAIYPASWVANEYYLYPTLFGLSIAAAAAGMAIFRTMGDHLGVQGARRPWVAAALIALILASNAWDYRSGFHQSYHPWPLVAQPAPFYSALQVATANVDRQPVLTDLPFTLYYAGADGGFGKFSWWGRSDAETIAAIASQRYEYIVFTYPPTIGIVNAIHRSGYAQIAPAAWRRAQREVRVEPGL